MKGAGYRWRAFQKDDERMKLEIHIVAVPHGSPQGGAQKPSAHDVEATRVGPHMRVTVDGRAIVADAIKVAECTYSVVIAGRSYEVRVEPGPGGLRVHAGAREFNVAIVDPRAWRGRHGGALEAEGRQEIVAPMPGKIVRVLAEQGAAVETGQGLLVIEAMKMQNEIKSPKKGTLERLLVKEGQAVNAGEPLAVVV